MKNINKSIFFMLVMSTAIGNASADGFIAGGLRDLGLISEKQREDLDGGHRAIKEIIPSYGQAEERFSQCVRTEFRQVINPYGYVVNLPVRVPC